MSDFDQTARAIADLEPQLFLTWLAARAGLTLTFREWYRERAAPRPASPERTADQVAVLDDPAHPEQPWLFLLEWQTRPNERKLDVLLEEAAILRSRAGWGPERDRPYLVFPVLLHLTGRAPEAERDMRTPSGHGSYHRPLAWDIETEDAAAVLERIASDALSWVFLFWLPLMQHGGEEIIIARWLQIVRLKAPAHRHGDLRETVLTFAELTGVYLAWERALQESHMGESQYINRQRDRARAEGELRTKRQDLVDLVDSKFKGAMSPEVRQLIEQHESMPVLTEWFRAALDAITYDDFLAVVRR
jgi:hypothetical protein